MRPQLVCGRDEGWLFLNRDGGQLSAKKLSARVSGYIARANLGKTGTCHLLRHTATTLMLEGGALYPGLPLDEESSFQSSLV